VPREMATSVFLLRMENGKDKLPFFCCKRKRKLFFLGRQTINDNRRLLFQQRRPSMWKRNEQHISSGYCGMDSGWTEFYETDSYWLESYKF
jgi:hypothetical protein